MDPGPNANHTDANVTASNNSVVDLLQEIFDVLQTSTIAEERGKDAKTKFWAAYKKVSGEYDDDMLGRCNGNMDIVLIFAGLFSAANTAFIIAMQPNPIDTTNALLVQLIQITLNDPSAVQPMIIPSSTGYSYSDFWTQALAYASLALSLLAAFGAVLGKQWLGYYKTNRYVRGSLEERCKMRHQKFQGLEKWCFEGVLETFPDLLKVSLFLFGLSLGSAMRSRQQTISVLIIALTACGALYYVVTAVAAVIYADCPFQTRISSVIRRAITSRRLQQFLTRISAVVRRTIISPRLQQFLTRISSVVRRTIISPRLRQFLTRISSVIRTTAFPCLQHDKTSQDPRRHGVFPDPQYMDFFTLSAVEWILKISTNPDVVRSALELLPSLPNNSPSVDLVSQSKRMRDMFRACFDLDGNATLKDNALAYGKALIYLFQTYPDETAAIRTGSMDKNLWISWRRLYLPWALKQCEISYHRMVRARKDANETLELQCQADTRSALRMAVVAGLDHFTDSDDLNLVWDGQFQLASNLPEVDWLMDCAEHFDKIKDVHVAGDALLLLSGVPNLSSPLATGIQARIAPFLNRPTSDPTLFRLRHIALRAAFRSLDTMDSFRCDKSLSRAVLDSIYPSLPSDPTIQFADAIRLLNFTKWPEDSDLGIPLSKTQFLILYVLPTPNVDNLERYIPYCNALVRCMGAGPLPCLRATALHFARTIREDLVKLSVAKVDALRDVIECDELCQALLAIFCPDGKENSSNLNTDYDLHYLRFIFALAEDYGSRLSKHHLIGRYNAIMEHWCSSDHNHQTPSMCTFYLAGILFRIQECAPDFHGGADRRWDLLRGAWHSAYKYDRLYDDDIDIDVLRTLVMRTPVYMPSDVSRNDLEVLRVWLGNALYQLGSRQPLRDRDIVLAVRDLEDKVHCRLQAL